MPWQGPTRKEEPVPVDREKVSRTVGELRAALPDADDLLAGLLQVAEATRTVLEADGAGLTVVHEDGPPAYSTRPRAWSAHELEAMRELAVVGGELVHTSVELASRELELAQLQQALTNRVWIEQAKGVLAATQGSDPEAAFQQLRARARASSRKLAELARDRLADERERGHRRP